MSELTPYLAVRDARAAIDWYAEAFAAVVSYDPIVMPDNRIGHVELTIGDDTTFMMADEHPEIGVVAPEPGRAAVTLHLRVEDCAAATDRCVAAGARLDREPSESAGGIGAVVIDPFGHRWMLRQD